MFPSASLMANLYATGLWSRTLLKEVNSQVVKKLSFCQNTLWYALHLHFVFHIRSYVRYVRLYLQNIIEHGALKVETCRIFYSIYRRLFQHTVYLIVWFIQVSTFKHYGSLTCSKEPVTGLSPEPVHFTQTTGVTLLIALGCRRAKSIMGIANFNWRRSQVRDRGNCASNRSLIYTYIYIHTHTHTHIYIYIPLSPTRTPIFVYLSLFNSVAKTKLYFSRKNICGRGHSPPCLYRLPYCLFAPFSNQ